MSVSAIFGARISSTPIISNHGSKVKLQNPTMVVPIECSSRPQKKATAHHRKSRPKKTQPWDIRRCPAVYAPFPPLPSDFTVVSSGDDEVDSSSSSLPESADSDSKSE